MTDAGRTRYREIKKVGEDMKEQTLTVQETADFLGVHRDTIYSMVRQKQIPHFRVRSRIFFTKSTLESWIAQQEEQAL